MCKLIEIGTDQKVFGKIADIKKDYILNIIEHARHCSSIVRIVLFGSCLEERCTDESDIDIAVFGNDTKYRVLRSKEYLKFMADVYDFGDSQDYDILYFQADKSEDSNIFSEINNGLVIYQREAS